LFSRASCQNLTKEWKTDDWPSILVLCHDYYNSVNPQGPPKQGTSRDGISSPTDRAIHHKKARQWFLQPEKYCNEITNEQKRFPEKCIYHLSKSHETKDFFVKQEGDKLIADKEKTSSSTMFGVGQLCHLTEELIEDGHSNESPDGSDVLLDSTLSNDTNQEDLIYFVPMTNHYLRLVWSTNPGISHHSMKYPIIVDSGANFHMFPGREFFTTMSPATGYVLLDDGKTILQIQGIGIISCKIGQHTLTVDHVRYIPDLAESIYSLFLHIQCPSHSLFSSYDEGLNIIFPEFRTKAILGQNDVYLDAAPANSFQRFSQLSDDMATDFCWHFKQDLENVDEDSKPDGELLKSLRKYYSEVKTKRQLNMSTPAGFHQTSNLQSLFNEFSPSA